MRTSKTVYWWDGDSGTFDVCSMISCCTWRMFRPNCFQHVIYNSCGRNFFTRLTATWLLTITIAKLIFRVFYHSIFFVAFKNELGYSSGPPLDPTWQVRSRYWAAYGVFVYTVLQGVGACSWNLIGSLLMYMIILHNATFCCMAPRVAKLCGHSTPAYSQNQLTAKQ